MPDQNIIKFLKIRDVKSPSRAHSTDAGIDFYVPEMTKDFIKVLMNKNPKVFITFDDPPAILLRPQERVLIPSGVHCQMGPQRALIAANKSGISAKYGLVFGSQVVDFEYTGEIHLSLINTGNENVEITGGMKILQFIETPIYTSDIIIEENKPIKDFYEKETERGARGFGSTDARI